MTCIGGYVDKKTGTIWMGADSGAFNVNSYDHRTRLDEKVFIKENMIFGFTSSYRMGDILHHSFTIPEHPKEMDDVTYLKTIFIDKLIECFKNKGYLIVKDNSVSGGFFLIGYKGKLYQVESDFQVAQNVYNYDSTGCGENYAMAAMYILENETLYLTPKEKIEKALEVSYQFSGYVRPPFVIKSL